MLKRVAAAVALCVFVTPVLMGAVPTKKPVPESEGFYILHVTTGDRIYSSDIVDLIPEPSGSEPGTVSPLLINDPIAWTACFGPTFNANYPLRSFSWVPQATGTVYLQCGPHDTKTYGWHHIQNEHQSQWQGKADAASGVPGGIAWDDFMADITSQLLDWPDRYTVEYSGKRCYTGYIQIWDLEGNLKYDFNPTIVVSMTNNRVITSYPTTNQDCSRQASWAF